MGKPAVSRKKQADTAAANLSPARIINIQFKTRCAEAVLTLMHADAER